MKRISLLILVLLVTLAGCGKNIDEPNVEIPKPSTEQKQVETKPEDQEGMIGYVYTLKDYIGFQEKYLTDEQRADANKIIDVINEAEANFKEGDEEKIYDLTDQLYAYLKTCGIQVPITTMEAFVAEYPDKFSSEDKKTMIDLDNQIIELTNENPENEAIITLTEKLSSYLEAAGFDPDDVYDQMQTGSIVFTKYNLNKGHLSVNTAKGEYKQEDIDKFNFLAQRVVDILPELIEERIVNIEVNTDGVDNILAFVAQKDDTLIKWRMVLDLSDAFDEAGNYRKDYDETIVHEGGHILTLNASQMQNESTGTYETEEGILSQTSYLNQFYEKFWLNIKDDFDQMVDPNNPDSAYDFYDKYTDQFVSDYAATNPEEDIAESFRVFVFSNKPEGDEIKDQKVKWFYEDETLVQLRKNIREAIGL